MRVVQESFLAVAANTRQYDDLPAWILPAVQCQRTVLAAIRCRLIDPDRGFSAAADFNGSLRCRSGRLADMSCWRSCHIGGKKYVWNHDNRLVELVPTGSHNQRGQEDRIRLRCFRQADSQAGVPVG